MFRPLPAALPLAALALPAAAEMTGADRSAFRAGVRAYLTGNPEVLMEAIAVPEERQAATETAGDQALVADNALAIFDDGHSRVGGNPDGDVVMGEFIDCRCGYCRRAWPETEQPVADDGQVRRIIQEPPILGPGSELSSRFAVAVLQLDGPEACKQTHDALRAEATGDSLARLALQLGLDTAAIMARMTAPEVTAVPQANRTLADKLGIGGTPTYVMGDTMVRGHVPPGGMQGIVAGARQGG